MSDRKSSLTLFFCLLVIGIIGCSNDDSKLDPIPLKAVEKQTPLTQMDINSYIMVLSEIAPVEFTDGKEAAKIYKKNGLSRLRYTFIKAKIPYCISVSAGSTIDFSKVPASLKPTDSELSLVNDNLEAIRAAFEPYNQAVVRKIK